VRALRRELAPRARPVSPAACPRCGSSRTLAPSAFDQTGPSRCCDCGATFTAALGGRLAKTMRARARGRRHDGGSCPAVSSSPVRP
jgi:hypothetical protein